MKCYKMLLVFIVLVTSTVSCRKDFLNVKDESVITRQEYVVDLKTTGAFLNGIYVKLGSNFYLGYNLIYPDLIADDIKPIVGSTMQAQYSWSQLSSGSNQDAMWQVGYQIARSCSFVLMKAEEFKEQDPAKANDFKAQAYAIRALVHFVMVNTFAQSYNFTANGSHLGIPYVATDDWKQPVSRQSVNEVYERMINDLNSAISIFNVRTTNVLFMNKNAAKALLARIYLFKEDYFAAKNIAREIGNAVPIMAASPEGYPTKLFTSEETEALFQLLPAGFPTGANYSTFFAGVYFSSPMTEFLATEDIAGLIAENQRDVRNNWIKSGGFGGDTIVKYPSDVVAGFPISTMSYYQTIFRSSEMYLVAAESYAKIDEEDSARYYLDAIRRRADPTVSATTAKGANLLDSIYKERRKELAFEGFRMFDLLRLRKEVNRRDAPNPSAQRLPYPSNKAISPIPAIDVDVLGLQQNPGY